MIKLADFTLSELNRAFVAKAKEEGYEANTSIYLSTNPRNCGGAVSTPVPTPTEEVAEEEEVDPVGQEDEESAADKKKRLSNEKRKAARLKKKQEAEAAAKEAEVEEDEVEEEEESEGVSLEDAQEAMLAACKDHPNTEVRALVNTFGVKKVSEMTAEQREDFVTQLAEEFPEE